MKIRIQRRPQRVVVAAQREAQWLDETSVGDPVNLKKSFYVIPNEQSRSRVQSTMTRLCERYGNPDVTRTQSFFTLRIVQKCYSFIFIDSRTTRSISLPTLGMTRGKFLSYWIPDAHSVSLGTTYEKNRALLREHCD